ncbi:MAG: hypothetical protein IJQ81_15230 [Oscillibacter sp.]|nr:hypothetical protein [Oscillibacter sp.]
MDKIRDELASEHPDYSLCLDALSIFPAQVTGVFYSNVYPSLSENIQKEWNQAFLKWVNSQPPKKKKQQAAFLRMSQAIKARLQEISSANGLASEIQWFIAHFADNSAQAISDIRDMKDKVSAEQLRKLLLLPVENWSVDKESLRTFFDVLFADFSGERAKKEYREFLMRTGLDGSGHGASSLAGTKAHKAEENSPVQAVPQKSASAEEPARNAQESVAERLEERAAPAEESEETGQGVSATSAALSKAAGQSGAESLTTETASAISAESQAAQSATENKANAEIPAKKAAPETPPSKSAENGAEQPQSPGTVGKANELIKLLERALASAKQESRNTEKLQESLARSESRLKESERQCADLTRKLGAARQENAELRMRLENAERQAESDRETAMKMKEEADTLQRMNKNSAEQALSGYKAELNSALKNVLENLTDTEAWKDIEMLSPLCDHLLGILKYKGISLEEQ